MGYVAVSCLFKQRKSKLIKKQLAFYSDLNTPSDHFTYTLMELVSRSMQVTSGGGSNKSKYLESTPKITNKRTA